MPPISIGGGEVGASGGYHVGHGGRVGSRDRKALVGGRNIFISKNHPMLREGVLVFCFSKIPK